MRWMPLHQKRIPILEILEGEAGGPETAPCPILATCFCRKGGKALISTQTSCYFERSSAESKDLLLAVLSQGWKSTNFTSSEAPGAPGLDFENWETTNLTTAVASLCPLCS
jgi:hypothetical protein